MKRKLLKFRYPLYVFISFIFIYGCTKIDTTTIGGGVLPLVDNINTFEQSFDVITKNYTDTNSDSTFVFSTDAQILGHLDDPIFGKTKADLYLQVTPPTYPFSFPKSKDSLLLDSAVLVVKYAGIYGDSLAKQKINVFRVTDDSFQSTRKLSDVSYTNKLYRIHEAVLYNNAELLGSTFISPDELRPVRKIAYKKDSVVSSQLRIRLNDNFGRLFLDQNGSGAFKNDTTYRAFFKGFALIPEIAAGGNALMYFLTNNDTKLIVYHRVLKPDATYDTTAQSFIFGNFSISANNITRDRSSGEIASHLDNNLPDNVMYLQGTPGTYARVTIPGLENLSNRIVHRAELVMKQIWNGPQKLEDDLYPAPYVYPEVYNTDSNAINFDDTLIYNPVRSDIYTNNAFYYLGGARMDTVDAGRSIAKYNINLTRYVQGIITRRTKNYPLHLTIPYRPVRFVRLSNSLNITPYSALGAGRLKAGGGNHPQYKMYLRIIYSKIQ